MPPDTILDRLSADLRALRQSMGEDHIPDQEPLRTTLICLLNTLLNLTSELKSLEDAIVTRELDNGQADRTADAPAAARGSGPSFGGPGAGLWESEE